MNEAFSRRLNQQNERRLKEEGVTEHAALKQDSELITDSPVEPEKIREPIWKLDHEELIRKIANKADYKIELQYSPELTQEAKHLINETLQFAAVTSELFREALWDALKDYISNGEPIARAILNHLEQSGLDLPRFSVYDANSGNAFLEKLGFGQAIQHGSILLTFNLPPPLAQYWRRSYREELRTGRNRPDDTYSSIVEWGHIYWSLMPIVWNEVDFYSYDGALQFHRLNDFGQHDPKNYYYLWEVLTW